MELVIAEAVAGDDEAAAVIGHVTIKGLLHIFVQRFGGDVGDNHGLVGEVVARMHRQAAGRGRFDVVVAQPEAR